MTAYRLPINKDSYPFRHSVTHGIYAKKLTELNQQPLFSNSKSIVNFDPIEMLDIFEHGKQIKVIERAIDEEVVEYLKLVAPHLGSGFKVLLAASQSISVKILAENILPNCTGRVRFLAELDCLTSLYVDLLGCPSIGVRLEVLNHAMCPKFHVDKTGIRLLCTYVGAGTQWLDDTYADRTKLGMASANMEDAISGVILDTIGIHQVENFHIALLKGSLWQGNGMRGVIHRSPAVLNDDHARVMLAIDAIW